MLRQIRDTFSEHGAGLTRAILAEMLGLSASALGSVQVALTGTSDSGTEQPAGWNLPQSACTVSWHTDSFHVHQGWVIDQPSARSLAHHRATLLWCPMCKRAASRFTFGPYGDLQLFSVKMTCSFSRHIDKDSHWC